MISCVMRKIFTFVLGLAMATAMLALPQTTLPVLEKGAKSSAKAIEMITRDVTKRVTRPEQHTMTADKSITAKYSIQSKQKAVKETINLDGGVFLVEPEYEAETGEWYIAVESNGYTFRLCWYAPEEDFTGTFTFDDISWDWTWGWYQSADLFYEIIPSDINMTISQQKVSNYLTQIVLDATIYDPNDNVYVLHIVHEMLSPKETIQTVLTNTQLTIGEGYYVLDGNDNKLDLQLTVNSSIIDGLYNKDYFDLNNTKITYNGVEQQILQATLMVMGGTLSNGSLGYFADLSFYNQDTVLHQVSMQASLPAVKDTIEITCTNLQVDESLADYGLIMVSGSNDFYDVFAMYEGEYAEAGVYNVSVSITDKITWLEPTEAITATLNLTEDTDGWHANIEAYGKDYNWYSIDMSYVVPEPIDTVDITFETTAIGTYLPYESNMLQLLHYGDDYEASITVYGKRLGDSFTMDNVLLDYSGIYNKKIGRSVIFADVNGTLNQYGDTTVISASVIGFDAVQYNLHLWYVAPTPIDTVEIEMPIEFINSMDYGYYTLGAYTPDSVWYISLSPMTSEVAGSFANDGLFGKMGAKGGQYDFYGGETYIYEEATLNRYSVEKGTLIVEMTSDGKITAEAKVICSNAIYYHIKMTSEYNTHLDFDSPDMDVDRLYTTEDNVFIENQVEENGYIYLSLTAADASDMAAFFFYTEEVDEDIIIPVGVYPIDYTEEYGTVQANPGVQGNGVLPSFYATIWEDGSLEVPLWLLVSGTVEVSKDEDGNPHLEVNAVNSYDVSVHIVYDGTPIHSAVENVQSQLPKNDCQKRIVNGQLMLIRNGEVYNILGTNVQ